jgi:hypothetical protein
MRDSLLAPLMADAHKFPEAILPSLFIVSAVERREIVRRPEVLASLWRCPSSELRTRALSEAMAEADRLPEIVLQSLLILSGAKRRPIVRRPDVLAALWRCPASELRTRALREASALV